MTQPAQQAAGAAAPRGFVPGLEGVVAFHTAIAEPDKDGGSLRYRGVDIEDLVGRVGFDDVWALLVDDAFGAALPVELEPSPVRSGDVRVDVQAGIPLLAATAGFRPLLDITDDQAREQLARTTSAVLSYAARSARGDLPEVPASLVESRPSSVERFLTAWLGEPSPEQVRAIEAYWVSAAEHGMNASTFTARVVASTGADVPACFAGAIGSMSGPLHGGAPARVLPMITQVEATGDPVGLVKGILDRREKLMGFGHRVYRAEDPRARTLRRVCAELGAPRYEAAAALEQAALTELRTRRPDHPIETNVEFWAAVILDFAGVPAAMMPAMFTCARTAGWSAHVLEQKRLGRIVRPSAVYDGPGPRRPEDVDGYAGLVAGV
ncbi:citrate synthase 2 [Nakamurella endophytica]|uniref:citrate synthase (unknown stereospecificity) n=1 Tax=Nakamurella endophytica TaxID=1748367 RepID=A0A917SNM5_9ACTN|nr:citrate synthase 2 [Nakamurella endophytica]GGL88611.1 citrate synthase [Nakamurella endophytica]